MDVKVTHLSVEVAMLSPGDMIILDNTVCEVIKTVKFDSYKFEGGPQWVVETFWFDETHNKRFYSKNMGDGATEVPWLVFRKKSEPNFCRPNCDKCNG